VPSDVLPAGGTSTSSSSTSSSSGSEDAATEKTLSPQKADAAMAAAATTQASSKTKKVCTDVHETEDCIVACSAWNVFKLLGIAACIMKIEVTFRSCYCKAEVNG
jgi:hypothetical protein